MNHIGGEGSKNSKNRTTQFLDAPIMLRNESKSIVNFDSTLLLHARNRPSDVASDSFVRTSVEPVDL